FAAGNACAERSAIRVPPPPDASTAGADTASTSAAAVRNMVMRFISNLLSRLNLSTRKLRGRPSRPGKPGQGLAPRSVKPWQDGRDRVAAVPAEPGYFRA